jgi:hypothetical protein
MQKFTTWKEELTRLHHDSIKASAPGFFAASGGYSMKIKPYTDTNTNGLTRCVKDFLTYKGHYVIRTNRQGQARIEKIPVGGTQRDISGAGARYYGKISYTKNPEDKAFTDLQASIDGLYVAIEIKCKATKDRMKDGQDKNKISVEKSGAIHVTVPDMLTFWKWYYEELPIIVKSKLK